MRAASAARPATGALRNEASCSLLSVRHEAAAAAPRRPPRAHPTRHSHSFGLRGGIRENALYISDSSIIYPVGAHVAVTHLDKREQQFLDLPRGVRSIDAMQTSPLQGSSVLASKYVALCEQAQASAGGPVHAQATVYSLAQRKKLQTVVMQTPHPFSTCAFSSDTKLLATLTADPDNQIAMWKWGGEKNNAMLSTSGPSHLRVWRLAPDFTLKPQQMVLTRVEQQPWVDHVWIGAAYVVAVTDSGSIVVLKQSENAEASQPSHSPAGAGALAMVGAVSSSTNHGALMLVQQLKCDLPEGVRVECLACHGKGFVVGGDHGCMAIFERQEDPKEPFSRAKVFAPGEEGSTGSSVSALAPSPNGESLLAVMRGNGSYALRAFPLAQYDALSAEGYHFAPVLGHDADPGPVGTLIGQAGCVLRPITVTISSDAVVRVWNFLTHRCEVAAQLPDEPTCTSLHPAGFILLLGFKDCVRVHNVQYRGLPIFRELPFKHCRVLAFSHGGHLFAAAFGIAITVFDTHTLQQRHSFTGHVGTITGLVWSEDDSTLASFGEDGAVYGWWIADGTRMGSLSHVVKGISHLDGVLERSTSTLVVASADHTLREIVDGAITGNVFPTGDAAVTQLLLTPQGTARFLLAGTSDGCIRVYAWPLASPDYREIRVHSGPVRRLCLSPDLKLDGTLFLLALERVERGVQVGWEPPQRSAYNADPLLLGAEEVQETADRVEDLAKQVEAERSDREYQLHMEQQRWQEEIRRRAEEGEAALEAERSRYKKLSREYEEFYKESMEKQKEAERRHAEDRQALINAHEHKWALEMERFDGLSEDMEALRQRCAKELEEQAAAHQQAMDREAEEARREKEALQKKVRQLDEDLQFNREKYAEVLQQQEDEYELELKYTKEKADTEVQQERSGTAVIERELNTLKNENNQLQKQLSEAHSQQQQLEDARLRMEERAAKLDKAREHLNQHLEERERSLKDKDRALLQLRSENRTLRNFRFVLDARIKTMMQERGPITDHIDRLEEHVRNMYGELVQEFGEKKTTDAEMRRMVLKADGLSAEVEKLRNLVREKDQTVASIRHDLSQTVQFKDPRDVEEGVKRMFRLYVKGDKQTKAVIPRGGSGPQQRESSAPPPRRPSPTRGQLEDTGRTEEGAEGGEEDGGAGTGAGAASRGSGQGGSDRDTAHELVRQRDYMERTVAVLRRSLKQAEQRLTQQSRQTVTENGTLISECNRLRRETKLQQQRIQQLTERVRMLQRQQGVEAGEGAEEWGERGGAGVDSPHGSSRRGSGGAGAALPPRSGAATAGAVDTRDAKGSSQVAGAGMRAARAAKGGSSRSNVVRLSSRVPSPIRSASHSTSVRGSVAGSRRRSRLRTSQSGAPPHLVTGGSANLRRANTARSRIYSMVEQLDGNDQRIEEQEAEIRQLKEQLHDLRTHLSSSGVSLPSSVGRTGADPLPPLQSASTAPAQVQLDSKDSGAFATGEDAGAESARHRAAPQSFSPASTAREQNVMGWGASAKEEAESTVAPTRVPTAAGEHY